MSELINETTAVITQTPPASHPAGGGDTGLSSSQLSPVEQIMDVFPAVAQLDGGGELGGFYFSLTAATTTGRAVITVLEGKQPHPIMGYADIGDVVEAVNPEATTPLTEDEAIEVADAVNGWLEVESFTAIAALKSRTLAALAERTALSPETVSKAVEFEDEFSFTSLTVEDVQAEWRSIKERE